MIWGRENYTDGQCIQCLHDRMIVWTKLVEHAARNVGHVRCRCPGARHELDHHAMHSPTQGGAIFHPAYDVTVMQAFA